MTFNTDTEIYTSTRKTRYHYALWPSSQMQIFDGTLSRPRLAVLERFVLCFLCLSAAAFCQ